MAGGERPEGTPPLPPSFVGRDESRRARTGGRAQAGASSPGPFTSRQACPQLVSFGLTVDEHYESARVVAANPTPLEVPIALDQDLTFAANYMFKHRKGLTNFRWAAVEAMAGLQTRWAGVTEHLRCFQAAETRQVTRGRDIGLIPLLGVLMRWPDF